MLYDKDELLAAVNDLILDPSPGRKVDALSAVINLRRLYPVKLTSDFHVLNPLVEIAVFEPEFYEKTKALIDAKRIEKGYEVLWPAKHEGFDKREYQRNLMAERRRLSGRASDIENLSRGKNDQLLGTLRLDFERRQLKTWGDRLDALLEKARQANGGKLPRAESEKIRDAFWNTIEVELDEAEEIAKLKNMKLPTKR